MKVKCLGAGQDIGRSCLILGIGPYTIMLDCGVHMSANENRFPSFESINGKVDCVIITHYHLDHIGALPIFTQRVGYGGIILMSQPTLDIAGMVLSEYSKNLQPTYPMGYYNSEDVKNCLRKVTHLNIHETFEINKHLKITFYYAGHVLGAVMVFIEYLGESLLYTGDFNTSPSFNLKGASLPKLCPSLLICEGTYAMKNQSISKAQSEDEMLRYIKTSLSKGGKVLLPLNSLNIQEFCLLLLESGINVPIYVGSDLAVQSHTLNYKHSDWLRDSSSNEGGLETLLKKSVVRRWSNSLIDSAAPCILLSQPAQLNGGLSLAVFCQWAKDGKNLILFTGSQMAGTVGYNVQTNKAKEVMVNQVMINVNCQIASVHWSNHADWAGLNKLIWQVSPSSMMLVHGEKSNLEKFSLQITNNFGIPCHVPQNNTTISIEEMKGLRAYISSSILNGTEEEGGGVGVERIIKSNNKKKQKVTRSKDDECIIINGVALVKEGEEFVKIMKEEEVREDLNIPMLNIL